MKVHQRRMGSESGVFCFYLFSIILMVPSFELGAQIEIDKAPNTSLIIKNSGTDGISIDNSSGDGISVFRSTDFGIRIEGNKTGSTIGGHVALIKNSSIDNNADILALQMGKAASPAESNNYITFYNGFVSNNVEGEIDGTGTGGVRYMSAGSDYAEYLPVLDISEKFEAGEVVGIYAGKISHQTRGADKVMVITRQAAVVGNRPRDKHQNASAEGYEIVSFIGQVRTKVAGKVHEGDWIVASGKNDGTAIALAADQIQLEHQIVGRAWETQEDAGIHKVNVAVGLSHNEAYNYFLKNQQEKLLEQQSKIEGLLELIEGLISKQEGSTIAERP